jgi:hypothetical protein
MANSYSNIGPDENQALAYDLRLFYAMYVGPRMLKIGELAEQGKYYEWFKELRYLFMTIFARVDTDRKAIREAFKICETEIILLAEKYPKVFHRRQFVPEQNAEIEDALLRFHHFVFRLLHLTDQLGTKSTLKGLY